MDPKDIHAEIVDGYLVVKVPINKPLMNSATGKTLVVASSRGNHPTTLTVEGQPVIIGLNAYIRKTRR